MGSVVERTGERLVERLFGQEAELVGASAANYVRNYEALPEGLGTDLALHALACVDGTAGSQGRRQRWRLCFRSFFSHSWAVLRAIQREGWQEVLALDDWWSGGARRGGVAFFDSLVRGGSELKGLVEGSRALRKCVVCQAFAMGLSYPVGFSVEQVDGWARSGLLARAEGIVLLCDAERARAVNLAPLLASPLRPCGILTDRMYQHVVLALEAPDRLGEFLIDKGGRRDYLVLASAALLQRRVSLDEAAFLVQVLRNAWKDCPDEEALEDVGDVLGECLPAVFLVKSVAGKKAVEVVSGMFRNSSAMARVGLATLNRYCVDGEAKARQRLIHQIEETGYLGCLAHAMLLWNGCEADETNLQSPGKGDNSKSFAVVSSPS